MHRRSSTREPDTNLAEAWNNAVEAAKVGGALGASTNTVSSAIEKGHVVEPGGAVTNSWRSLPLASSGSESAAASSQGGTSAVDAAPAMQGANGPNGLAARLAQEWGLNAQSPAPQGTMRNDTGEPAVPATLPVEHPVSTGGVVGGAEGSYAGPSTSSSPLVSSANPPAQGEGEVSPTEVSPTNEDPASGGPSPANEGTRPSVAVASHPAVNVTASPTPVSSPQTDVVVQGQAPAAPPSLTAPPADTKTDTSAPKSNKRLTKEQQSEVKTLGNIRTRIEGMRKQSQRSELRESHRAAIERELPYYLAKEAEFAAKVDQAKSASVSEIAQNKNSIPSHHPKKSAHQNTTRSGVKRKNSTDWRNTRDLWDELGYKDLLSSENRKKIAQGLVPSVDDAWISYHPEDAGLLGELITMHHVLALPLTGPLPKTRHLNSHLPGGTRYNPGQIGSQLPLYLQLPPKHKNKP